MQSASIFAISMFCKNTTFFVFCKGKAGKNLYIYDNEEIFIYDNSDNWDTFYQPLCSKGGTGCLQHKWGGYANAECFKRIFFEYYFAL